MMVRVKPSQREHALSVWIASRAGIMVLSENREIGGAKRDRTADLYNAIVALSQLSYSPLLPCLACNASSEDIAKRLFGANLRSAETLRRMCIAGVTPCASKFLSSERFLYHRRRTNGIC